VEDRDTSRLHQLAQLASLMTVLIDLATVPLSLSPSVAVL
jgi:hypothetical protein